MKSIINGKKYDTSTAELIGEGDNSLSCNDFKYCNEQLYRKRTGEFFLYGEGGPMTEYAKDCPGGWCGGERISPYTDAEAREWCENHLDADKYEAIFGPVEE